MDRVRSRGISRRSADFVEFLEPRQLLSATLTTPIGTQIVAAGAGPTTLDLTNAVSDPAVALVDFTTTNGPIDLQLTPQTTPRTVANFLQYVNSGAYNGTIVHRSVPGFVVQGGGFTTTGAPVTTLPAVASEATSSTSNTAGTIAMALSSGSSGTTDANSGTDQWFVNLVDNSSSLDSEGFTAFGKVVNNTTANVNAIAALPVIDGDSTLDQTSADSGLFSTLPVQSSTGGTAASNLVVVQSAAQVPTSSLMTYTVTSDNPALVAPAISGDSLTLTYPSATDVGVAHITVTATDSADQSSASQTFTTAVGVTPVMLGTGGAKTARFTDASGHLQTVSLTGPGGAVLGFAGTGVTASAIKGGVVTVTGTGLTLAGVSTTDTTAKTNLAFKSARGATLSLGSLGVGQLGKLSAPSVSLTGTMSAAGTIKNLSLGSVVNGAISASAPIAALTIGAVSGGSFKFTDAVDVDVAKFTVTHALSGATLSADGSLGTVSVGASANSAIYAGVTPVNPQTLPSLTSEFTGASHIAAVKIKQDSSTIISAGSLGNLTLAGLDLATGGNPFGVAAHSIQALTAVAGRSKIQFKKLTSAAALSAQVGKQKVTVATDGDISGTDFNISIV